MGETRVIIINLLNKFYYVNCYTISQIQIIGLVFKVSCAINKFNGLTLYSQNLLHSERLLVNTIKI